MEEIQDNDERNNRLIYSRVTPISSDLKNKVNLAFSDFINRFKDRHLS